MPTLTCEIAGSLWAALKQRCTTSGEPLAHVVSRALADALQVDHATLFQVSTAGALVEGVFQGVVSVATLKEHGDFGLGTFADLDGEMALLDGHCWQVTGDGQVREAADGAMVPFAVVLRFRAEHEAEFAEVTSFADLCQQLDGLRDTGNLFFAVRIDGVFDHIRTRAVCKVHDHEGLVAAAGRQAEFEFRDIEGTLVGFWTPPYARAINVAGYHLHFLSHDRSAAGHLLACSGRRLRVQIEHAPDFRMAIPETAAFLRADLSGDPSAVLERAERER